MSTFASHPRYSLALIALLSLVFISFVNNGSEPHDPFFHPDAISDTSQGHSSSGPKHQGGLAAQLAESERWYNLKLKDRARLITRWGPKASNVVSYVTHERYPRRNSDRTSVADFQLMAIFIPFVSLRCADSLDNVDMITRRGFLYSRIIHVPPSY